MTCLLFVFCLLLLLVHIVFVSCLLFVLFLVWFVVCYCCRREVSKSGCLTSVPTEAWFRWGVIEHSSRMQKINQSLSLLRLLLFLLLSSVGFVLKFIFSHLKFSCILKMHLLKAPENKFQDATFLSFKNKRAGGFLEFFNHSKRQASLFLEVPRGCFPRVVFLRDDLSHPVSGVVFLKALGCNVGPLSKTPLKNSGR